MLSIGPCILTPRKLIVMLKHGHIRIYVWIHILHIILYFQNKHKLMNKYIVFVTTWPWMKTDSGLVCVVCDSVAGGYCIRTWNKTNELIMKRMLFSRLCVFEINYKDNPKAAMARQYQYHCTRVCACACVYIHNDNNILLVYLCVRVCMCVR